MKVHPTLQTAVARARSRIALRSRVRRRWSEFKYRMLQRRMAGPRLIRAFAEAYPHAFFVEIGSNDGEQLDHLSAVVHSRPWRGIMVEPVPYVFERLQRNYGDRGGIILENAAIAERESRMPFYHLARSDDPAGEGLPEWYDALGSFALETLLGHRDKIPDLDRRVVETEVPCLTFGSLLAKHRVDHVDLLLIDTEGYDWEIIKSIDLDAHRPRIMIYEHFHLGSDTRAACRRHVEGFGYETMEEGFDTFCLDARVDDGLTRFWRRLRPAVPGTSAEEEAR